jgi:hypothetical protein
MTSNFHCLAIEWPEVLEPASKAISTLSQRWRNARRTKATTKPFESQFPLLLRFVTSLSLTTDF